MQPLTTSLRGASLFAISLLAELGSAQRMMRSTSLAPCMANSGFEASMFNVTFTPDDNNVNFQMNARSTVSGRVRAEVTIIAYGFSVMDLPLDPCEQEGLEGMCPMSAGPLDIRPINYKIDSDAVNQIPDIAYKIPDPDIIARMRVLDAESGNMIACVEAPLTNRYTVEHEAVGWVTAVIAGLALIVSAIISGLGHNWTAAHVAANALSLFSYFQAQAMVSLIAVPLPPIVAAWTQNYDWALGIIRIKFMQRVLHWYIQATGGSPSNLYLQMSELSVQVAKRSLPESVLSPRAAMWGFGDSATSLVKRAGSLIPRINNDAVPDTSTEAIKVTGIQRMSFKANIEHTNFFITGLAFFVAFIFFVALGVAAFRWIYIELAHNKMKPNSFRDFRARWQVILKGIMYRIVLIGFPQMMILCPYEWTAKDSPAAVVLAVFFFIAMVGILSFCCFKVLSLGFASKNLDASANTTAYKLYNDPAALNRWGYLYVQFRRPTFYFIVPVLVHALIKSFLIALMQKVGKAQAVCLLVLELAYLITVSVVRPWLDKRTNIVNISIATVNFVNAICILIFSGITTLPAPAHGVLGVIFFVMNGIFTLVLMLLVLISAGIAVFSKNPEKRFQAVGDPDEKRPPTGQIRDLDDDDVLQPVPNHRRESVNTEQAMSIRNNRDDEIIRPIAGELRPGPNPGAGGWTPRSTSPAPGGTSPHLGAAQGPVNWQSGVGYERTSVV